MKREAGSIAALLSCVNAIYCQHLIMCTVNSFLNECKTNTYSKLYGNLHLREHTPSSPYYRGGT